MTEGATGGGDAAAYLVVLRHVLVAEDITLTIADHAPGSLVLTVASAAEAIAALAQVARLAVAFVSEAPRAYAGSALAQEIAARGGRVVLMGEAAEEEGTALGFAVLARPFGTDDVLAHLARERA